MEPTEVLAIVGGHVDEELLLRNEYLAAENEILKSKIEGPVRLTNRERIRLAKISRRLGGVSKFYYRKAAWVAGIPPTWMSSRWPQPLNPSLKPMLSPGFARLSFLTLRPSRPASSGYSCVVPAWGLTKNTYSFVSRPA